MIYCAVCNKPFKGINKRHLFHHNLTREEYIQKFPDSPIQSPESSEKRKEASLKRETSMLEETRIKRAEKISKSRIGIDPWNKDKPGYKLEWSDEARARVAERGPYNKGVPRSEEDKKKQSITMKAKCASEDFKHWNKGKHWSEDVKNRISTSNLGKTYTEEQTANHLAAMRRIVSSPDYVSPMKGKTHNDETKKKLSEASLRNAAAVRKKHEEAGRWIPKENLPEMERFRQEVWKLTNRIVHLIEGFDESKRGVNSLTADNYQVDHRYSITQGYLDGLSPEQLSHPANLRFIPWRDNAKKSERCDFTLHEFLELIK